jgi:hypothetical protein
MNCTASTCQDYGRAPVASVRPPLLPVSVLNRQVAVQYLEAVNGAGRLAGQLLRRRAAELILPRRRDGGRWS